MFLDDVVEQIARIGQDEAAYQTYLQCMHLLQKAMIVLAHVREGRTRLIPHVLKMDVNDGRIEFKLRVVRHLTLHRFVGRERMTATPSQTAYSSVLVFIDIHVLWPTRHRIVMLLGGSHLKKYVLK